MKTTELLNINANVFVPGPDLPYRCRMHKMVRRPSDGLVFLGAGKCFTPNDGTKRDLLFSYNFDTAHWDTTLSPMSVGRNYPGMAMTQDEARIFVAGGRYSAGGYSFPDHFGIEAYRVADNEWETLGAALPAGASYAFLAQEGGRFFAVRAQNNLIYEYDSAGDKWDELPGIKNTLIKYDSSVLYIGELSDLCG